MGAQINDSFFRNALPCVYFSQSDPPFTPPTLAQPGPDKFTTVAFGRAQEVGLSSRGEGGRDGWETKEENEDEEEELLFRNLDFVPFAFARSEEEREREEGATQTLS